MAQAKHTPGPWIVFADTPSVDPNWHMVTTANKLRVLANVHIEPGNAMAEPNARLIAAAPDMAERLKAAAELLERLAADPRLSGDAALDDILAEANLIHVTLSKAGGRS